MLIICGGGLTLCILWVWTIFCGMSLCEHAHGSSAFMEAWRQTRHTSQRNKQREILFSADVFHFSLGTFESWLCTCCKVHIFWSFFEAINVNSPVHVILNLFTIFKRSLYLMTKWPMTGDLRKFTGHKYFFSSHET